MDAYYKEVLNKIDVMQGLTFFYNKLLAMADNSPENKETAATEDLNNEAEAVKKSRKAGKPKKSKKHKEPKVEEFKAGEYVLCPYIKGYIDQDLLVTQHRYGESYYADHPYYNSRGVDKDYILIAFRKTEDEDAPVFTTIVTLPSYILDEKLVEALYTSAEYREEHENDAKKSARPGV